MKRQTIKDNNKVKKKYKFENVKFCAVFNCSNRADIEKNKANFPKMLKIMAKKA